MLGFVSMRRVLFDLVNEVSDASQALVLKNGGTWSI
jgi:hypothetical protein